MLQHLLIIVSYISWCKQKVDQLPLLVNDQMSFKAIEPAHRAFASAGLLLKDLMMMNSSVITHRQRLGIDKVAATTLRQQGLVLEKHIQPWQQAGNQGNKPLLAHEQGKVALQVAAYMLLIVVLKAFIA
jgi:hypothetical protein